MFYKSVIKLCYNVLVNKKKITIIIFSLICLFLASLFLSPLSFATDNESSRITETIFFGNLKDDGSACGVFTVLHSVIDIFSIGIGILAVIGITIVGTKYLTAGGNEEQTRKAKHRMFQIVIGIVLYAVLYIGLQWLVPGGKLDFGDRCVVISDEELAKIKEKEKAEREAQRKKNEEEATRIIAQRNSGGSSSGNNSNSTTGEGDKKCLKHATKAVKDKGICNEKTGAERLAKTAELLAQPSKEKSRNHNPIDFGPTSWQKLINQHKGRPAEAFMTSYDEVRPSHWQRGGGRLNSPIRLGASCDVFVATVIRASGYDSTGGFSHGSLESKILANNYQKWKIIKNHGSSAKRGDICHKYSSEGAHIKIYLGNHKIAEANSGLKSGDKRWGGVTSGDCKGYTLYRAIK